jgi:hypothetical protein
VRSGVRVRVKQGVDETGKIENGLVQPNTQIVRYPLNREGKGTTPSPVDISSSSHNSRSGGPRGNRICRCKTYTDTYDRSQFASGAEKCISCQEKFDVSSFLWAFRIMEHRVMITQVVSELGIIVFLIHTMASKPSAISSSSLVASICRSFSSHSSMALSPSSPFAFASK